MEVRNERAPEEKTISKMRLKTILLILLLASTRRATETNFVQSRKWSDDSFVQAIIGEAAGQSFAEKLAIAGALRNRGTLDGVRGFKNQRMIQNQPPRVWLDARNAWAQSATNDVTHGATFFESDQFPRPAWSKNMTVTAHIGVFTFLKK